MQSAYENCHIFYLDKFIPSFLDFLSDHIGLENNGLFIWGQENYAYGLKKNYTIHWIHNNETIQNLVQAMRNAKRIFLHGLFVNFQVELLYHEYELLRKCFWLIWGGDLYLYREQLDSPSKRIIEAKRRYVISRMGFLVGIPGDCDLAAAVYKSSGEKIKWYGYPNNYEHEYIDEIAINQHSKAKSTLLLGNSATLENRHLEALQILSKYNESLTIYCPLTYGSSDYAELVTKIGSDVFGNNFIPLRSHQPLDEYNKFLKSIDIGFFYNNRQQGMGNLTRLLGLGKKVFLTTGMTHSELFQDLGVVIFDPDRFDLNPIKHDDALSNNQIIRKHFSLQQLVGVYKFLLGR
jgi:dTDP-N-acetylfucosamine:lipid II N-acetylfucosaminyltransferase